MRLHSGSTSAIVLQVLIVGLMLHPVIAPPAAAQSPDAALRGHGGPICSIAVLDDKSVVTGGFDAAIIVRYPERDGEEVAARA